MSDSVLSGPISNIEEFCSSNQDIEQLKQLDNLLKCRICYEYFNTCVVTDCSHNFCSLCIRKYIQFKTECPVCFKELYDSQLRANRIMDNFIEIYPQLKDRIIRCIRTIRTLKPNCIYISPSKNSDPSTPKKCPNIVNKNELPTMEKEDSASLLTNRPPIVTVSDKQNILNGIKPPNQNKIVIPKIFQSPVKKKSLNGDLIPMVNCPVCSVMIPERNINLHLDTCLGDNKEDLKKKSLPLVRRPYLPKLVFRLMSNSALRNKAKEYGLNCHGDYETLKNRIQRYTVLYNAECDKMNPRPVFEINRQLETEEKMLTNQKFTKSIFTSRTDDVSVKEELNALYLKENKKYFEKLIENVKCREVEVNDVHLSESAENPILHEFCQPSTSKSYSFENFSHDNHDDMIEMEEMKIKHIKNESAFLDEKELENAISEETPGENMKYTAYPIKRKRLRNKRFHSENLSKDSDNSESSLVKISPVKLEPNIEIYEELTDEENNKHCDANFNAEDNESLGSPILQKRIRRKLQVFDQSLKKNLHKRNRSDSRIKF